MGFGLGVLLVCWTYCLRRQRQLWAHRVGWECQHFGSLKYQYWLWHKHNAPHLLAVRH